MEDGQKNIVYSSLLLLLYLCLPVVLLTLLSSHRTLRVYPFQFPRNDCRMRKCIVHSTLYMYNNDTYHRLLYILFALILFFQACSYS